MNGLGSKAIAVFVGLIVAFVAGGLGVTAPARAQSVADGKTAVSGTPHDDCANDDPPPDDCPPGGCGGGSDDLSDSDHTGDCGAGGQSSNTGSSVDNLALRYLHDAVDYRVQLPSGCEPCGGGSAALPGDGVLPSLELRRYHKYDEYWAGQKFGRHVCWQWDIELLWWINEETIRVRQPDSRPMYLQDKDAMGVADGVFYDLGTLNPFSWSDPAQPPQRRIQKLEVLDANGQPTAVGTQAVTARLTRHDGITYEFQMFQNGSSVQRYGRITKATDRNGNAITFSYYYQPGAAPTNSHLFQLQTATDAYGKEMSFHYATSQVSGLWVVERVELPNGEEIEYEYGDFGVDIGFGNTTGLVAVDHPDGTRTTIAASHDATSGCDVFSIFDPAAEPTHRKKDVYLSPQIAGGPGGPPIVQGFHRVRMVVNGEDEISYLSWQGTVQGERANFVYEGGHKLFALVHDRAFTNRRYVKTSFAPTDLGVTPTDWSSGWELDYSGMTYDPDTGRITATTDGAGHTTEREVDPVTGAVTRIDYPDATFATTTYNGFKQPLVVTDRLGRVTEYTYDAHGNKLTETRAKNMQDEATWSWTYNGQGQPLTATDAVGNVTEYFYSTTGSPSNIDGSGYLVKVLQPADTVSGPRAATLYAYDTAGRLESMTDPMGRETEYTYDERNRVTRIDHADGSYEAFTYNTTAASPDQGLLIDTRDRNGNIERCAYDAAGRQTSCTEAHGTGVAAVRATTYLLGTTLADTVTDKGDTIAYAYDHRHRLVEVGRKPNGNTTLVSVIVWDANDRIDYEEDPYGRRTYRVYDVNDRLKRKVTETVSAPGSGLSVPLPGSYNTPTAYLAARDAYLLGLSRASVLNAGYLIGDYVHDAEGQLLSHRDGRGVTHTYEYDEQGRKVEMVEAALDPNGQQTTVWAKTFWWYDEQGNVVQIAHPRHFDTGDALGGNFITAMTYTGRNLLKTRTEASGTSDAATESWTYHLDGREATHTDFRGNTWETTWGACCARIQSEADPAADVDGSGTPRESATVTRHDDHGNLTHTGRVKDVTAVTFPSLGGANATNLPDGDTLLEVTTRYDARHRPVARTVWLVPRGSVDANNVPIAGQNGIPASEGLTTTWVYDDSLGDGFGLDSYQHLTLLDPGFFVPGSDGYAVEETNPEGEKSVTVYDGIGRVVMTIDGEGDASIIAYDQTATTVPGAPGTLVATEAIDPLGHTTTRYADAAGRVLAIKDAEGEFTVYSYDHNGNRRSFRDPNGVGEDCLYDFRNRKIECKDTQEIAEGRSRLSAYDRHNNLVSTTDAKGESETFAYDRRDRRTSHTDRINATTTWTYDANNNELTVTDAESGRTDYAYDPRNLQVSIQYPGHVDGSIVGDASYDQVILAYDGLHRIRARKDQPGAIVYVVYDLAGRLIQRSYPDGQHDVMAYDRASRLTSATSNRYVNTVTFTYHGDGNIATESLTAYGQTYTLQRSYDASDRLVGITYPSGKVVARSYTDRNQLQSVTYDSASVASFVYDPGMRESQRTFGNGIVTTRSYTRADDLVTSIDTAADAGLSFDYQYDANKNPTAETTGGVMAGRSFTTSYDDQDRLLNWLGNNGDSQAWNLTPVGDWNDITINGILQDRTHNAVHEVQTVGAAPLTHDAKGNVTRDHHGIDYTYDDRNQLVGLHNSAGGSPNYTFGYDALGRRVTKTTSSGTRVYVSLTIEDFEDAGQVVAEYAAGLSPTTPEQSYVAGEFIDEYLAMIDNDTCYYHSDRLFNVVAITAAGATVLERYAYSAYGAPTILAPDGVSVRQASAVGNSYLFSGREYEGAGLYYYRGRHYHSELGRFVSRDLLGYVDGPHLYSYVGNSPLVYVDPLGLARNCRRDAIRLEVEVPGVILSIGKKLGIHQLKAKVHGEYKICEECCPKTNNKLTYTDRSFSFGYLIIAEFGSPEYKVWKLKVRIGWYGRITGSGSLSAGYSHCEGAYGGGCGSISGEAGFIGEVKAGDIGAGARGGVNVTVKVCGACSENSGCAATIQICGDIRGRFWGKAKVWGWKLEYFREWQYGGCSGKYPIPGIN